MTDTKAEKTMKVTLFRAYWSEAGRHDEGTDIDLPESKALDMIEAGAAKRVKA